MTHVKMKVVDMFTHPSLPVELLSAAITDVRVGSIMIEHVGSKLRILNEFLTANHTFVVSSARVSAHVSVERLFSCKPIATRWTC